MTKQLTRETIQVGQVVGYQFGATMTLYDFYKVMEIKGSTVLLAPVITKETPYGFLQVEVIPTDKVKIGGQIIKKRFNKYNELKSEAGRYGRRMFIVELGEAFHENHAD